MKRICTKVRSFFTLCIWVLEILLIISVVAVLSLRFLIPFPRWMWGNQYEEWMKFVEFSISLWVLFEISKLHKKHR